MSKDPMLCAPCRIGNHRQHDTNGCSNDNNFNSDCECPVTADDITAFEAATTKQPEVKEGDDASRKEA